MFLAEKEVKKKEFFSEKEGISDSMKISWIHTRIESPTLITYGSKIIFLLQCAVKHTSKGITFKL